MLRVGAMRIEEEEEEEASLRFAYAYFITTVDLSCRSELTPCIYVRLDKPPFVQLLKNFPEFYGT
jgi:hypothetical protein